ncbi:MAG: hypothetical protein JW936_08800 [Sedimentisphaerales bacterium]|nr:hypothetical protein [Sedimentisphaerales bacterium]
MRKQKTNTAGFSDDGSRYIVRDPHFIKQADSFLWNDNLYMRLDQRCRCNSYFVQPAATTYSSRLRCFYIRDDQSGKFWSAPFDPVCRRPDDFEFSVGRDDIKWWVRADGIEISIRASLPKTDPLELWTVTVTNVSSKKRKLSLYPCIPIGYVGPLADKCDFNKTLGGIVYESFPYYARIEDYHKLRNKANNVICISDTTPTSYECDLDSFTGDGGLKDPCQLHQPKLSGGMTTLEPSAAILQFARTLAPGKHFTVNLICGPAKDQRQIKQLKRKYLSPGGIEKAIEQVRQYRQQLTSTEVRIDTPDKNLNHFINSWLPNAILYMATTTRVNRCPCCRNAIQEAMGAVLNAPEVARKQLLKWLSFQTQDGDLPHGLPLEEGITLGGINLIHHRDMNVWAPGAIAFYINETGDQSILDEIVPFSDNPKGATLFEHICLGLAYCLRDRTKRGLSHIGEGDWNDPLNMAGPEGKGESTWLTEALAYALDQWAMVAQQRGDSQIVRRFRREADRCRKALNSYMWDGKWYARGSTDAGKLFGTKKDKEGMIFLNAQSWAIISGTAQRKRLDSCVDSVEKHLMSPCGAMTLGPGFTGFRGDIGKLTQKNIGHFENGAVYCHAGVFYAFSLYLARKSELAYRALRRLLAGGKDNPIKAAGQLPIFLPNYYVGLDAPKNVGKSSHDYNTGTAAWYYRTVVTQLLGIRGETDGLRIDPQLPAQWNKAQISRTWRQAKFDITIRKTQSVQSVEVSMNGKLLPENLIPPQAPGSNHTVLVKLPKR